MGSPITLSAHPPKNSKHSAAAGISIGRDSKIGFRLWSVSSRAISSARSSSRSPIRRTNRPRSRADSDPHGPFSAARAACTAASTSRVSADATVAITSSVAGLVTSMVFPPDAARHSLLMKSFFCSTAVIAMRRYLSLNKGSSLTIVDLRLQIHGLSIGECRFTLAIGDSNDDCRLPIRLAIGDWRLAIGDWRLAIGDWRLAIGVQITDWLRIWDIG